MHGRRLQAVPVRVSDGTRVGDVHADCFVRSKPESDVIVGGAPDADWRHRRRLGSGRPCGVHRSWGR